ncbi:MAG TPA: histone deacetylase family protein [Planctomycetaceae bacterium]|nr:histone deacetylase family protein [Planctomycetaceae bacterium]
MFRVRRIYDDILPVNQAAIRDVQQILADQFTGLAAEEIARLPERLRNPGRPWSPVLLVAENARRRVLGFALAMTDPELKFAYLDYLATAKSVKGRGVGAALYEHVRDEALALGTRGVFFECLPDEPDRCSNPEIRKSNAARLRFYETYGARPIVHTAYETPCTPAQTDNLPFLMFDDLDRGVPLRAADARLIVTAILERKYRHLCTPEYIANVAASFRDDPVPLRPPRYVKKESSRRPASMPARERMAVTINDRHEIHHIRERGYVEAPVRIKAIRSELEPSGLIEPLPVRSYPEKHILAVHDARFVSYLRRACAGVPEGKSIYPYVFPVRNAARPPKELSVRAGYYCIDTFTPINRNAFPAAKRAVDCTLTAADEVLRGRRVAYALVRPPGHHAERKLFGGFCYFNNAAVAAHYLTRYGRVAILDIDYHHGNGQQEIFYERNDVLTVSIHGDPEFAYPYFTGFAGERGAGAGAGYNLNIVLPEVQNGPQYRQALERALAAVTKFKPVFLVVALGLDSAKGDPTGTWLLLPRDFQENGRMIGGLRLPTLVVQEGGYRTRTLGTNARRFFQGLLEAIHR